MLLEPSLPHLHFTRASQYKTAVFAVVRYLSVRLSVTIQYCINTAYLIVEILSSPDSRNILVL